MAEPVVVVICPDIKTQQRLHETFKRITALAKQVVDLSDFLSEQDEDADDFALYQRIGPRLREFMETMVMTYPEGQGQLEADLTALQSILEKSTVRKDAKTN